METYTTIEEITELALQLPPLEKARLMERLAATLGQELSVDTVSRRTLYGVCHDMPANTPNSDTDAAYFEMWESFNGNGM